MTDADVLTFAQQSRLYVERTGQPDRLCTADDN